MMRSLLLTKIALVAATTVEQSTTPDYAELWRQFKKDYSRDYAANGKESESHRFEIFKSNVEMIREQNAKNLSYRLGVNQFTDHTVEEFSATYLDRYRSDWKQFEDYPTEPFSSYDQKTLGDEVDWVSRGAVTPVKSQQCCGSAWAFSTTGSVEGAYFIASGKLLSLSEAELVECDEKDPGYEFNYIKDNGISTEAGYPHTCACGRTGRCATEKRHPVVKISGFVDIPLGDEDALKAAVATQPVSVNIQADKLMFYQSGVFDDSACGKQLDHAVLNVGYGTDGKDYWKLKNSWAESWGEEGYIRMVRGKNMCGIALEAAYPTGASSVGPDPPPGPTPIAPKEESIVV